MYSLLAPLQRLFMLKMHLEAEKKLHVVIFYSLLKKRPCVFLLWSSHDFSRNYFIFFYNSWFGGKPKRIDR
jgi:hypothetical protein